jgi:hypothetical protein
LPGSAPLGVRDPEPRILGKELCAVRLSDIREDTGLVRSQPWIEELARGGSLREKPCDRSLESPHPLLQAVRQLLGELFGLIQIAIAEDLGDESILRISERRSLITGNRLDQSIQLVRELAYPLSQSVRSLLKLGEQVFQAWRQVWTPLKKTGHRSVRL